MCLLGAGLSEIAEIAFVPKGNSYKVAFSQGAISKGTKTCK